MIAATLARTGLHPDRLELEVTESVLIDDADQALQALLALKALGLRIVLDDFGTGYSSLSYLRRFPFDKIKIDRSFITDLSLESGSHAIVSAILAMSGKLGLQVTAEGGGDGRPACVAARSRVRPDPGFSAGAADAERRCRRPARRSGSPLNGPVMGLAVLVTENPRVRFGEMVQSD